jgi:hypothetical protein
VLSHARIVFHLTARKTGIHNMAKSGGRKRRPQGCSLRSHRLRRLKPLTPTLSPATHSAMPSMLPCCTSDLKRRIIISSSDRFHMGQDNEYIGHDTLHSRAHPCDPQHALKITVVVMRRSRLSPSFRREQRPDDPPLRVRHSDPIAQVCISHHKMQTRIRG